MNEKKWIVSVTQLICYFREALIAMTPIADKICMPWREPNNYDDWDSIASAIYASIVIKSIENSTEFQGAYPLPHYDLRVESYQTNSRIGIVGERSSCALICLETKVAAFDTCRFARLNAGGLVVGTERRVFDDTEFTLVLQQGVNSLEINKLNVAI